MVFCCETLEEPEDSDESEYDEATHLVRATGEHEEDPANPKPSLCPQCGRPLRRIVKLPALAAFLACMRQKECIRCYEGILAGEMHFACSSCPEVAVCMGCGPGVYVERVYDFVTPATGEARVKEVPEQVIHRRRTRSSIVGGVQQLAHRVVENTRALVQEVSKGEDIRDCEWEDEGLLMRLLGATSIEETATQMHQLVAEAKRIFACQPSLTEAQVPCKVFGDIHGQLRDLLLFFKAFGMPGVPGGPRFVFNGDFVDRGAHQLEVLAVLLAHKIAFPSEFYMNRGNHEDEHMNAKYGFIVQCKKNLGEVDGVKLYGAINDAFDHLPLACLIGGRVIALHGGIGNGRWTLDQLREVQRPLRHDDLASNDWIWNILWSDPIEEDEASARKTFGVHNSPRSKSACKFGWNVTSKFCMNNGLDLVIRSHQAKKDGFGFDIMHNNCLVRVFSARDYEKNGNDGALLHVSQDSDEDDVSLLRVRPQVLHSITKFANDFEADAEG